MSQVRFRAQYPLVRFWWATLGNDRNDCQGLKEELHRWNGEPKSESFPGSNRVLRRFRREEGMSSCVPLKHFQLRTSKESVRPRDSSRTVVPLRRSIPHSVRRYARRSICVGCPLNYFFSTAVTSDFLSFLFINASTTWYEY